MKKILLLLFLILTLSISAFSQTTLNLWGGYSSLRGIIGAEAQFKQFGISAGYLPVRMPESKEYVSSFSAAVTLYGKDNVFPNNLHACLYLSGGVASAGNLSHDVAKLTGIGLIGIKTHKDRWSFKLGGGVEGCDVGTKGTMEIGFGYRILSTK